jgi:hypothetical protein
MKVYPLETDGGEVFGFRIDNHFLSSSGMARFFRKCAGIEIISVRRLFAFGDEIHVEFALDGDGWQVWEPHGDSSELWVVPSVANPGSLRPASFDRLTDYVSTHWPGPILAARAKLIEKIAVMFR